MNLPGVTYTCDGCGRETLARGALAETAPPTFTAYCRDCGRASLYLRRPHPAPVFPWQPSAAELERLCFARYLYMHGRIREFDLTGRTPDPPQE